jgi:hypothetical protein
MTGVKITLSGLGGSAADIVAEHWDAWPPFPARLTVGRAVLAPARGGGAEGWLAYLWPSAGERPDDEDRQCERVRRGTAELLEGALKDRLGHGRWWR